MNDNKIFPHPSHIFNLLYEQVQSVEKIYKNIRDTLALSFLFSQSTSKRKIINKHEENFSTMTRAEKKFMLSCKNDKYKDCVCKKQIGGKRDRKDKRRQFKSSRNASNNGSSKNIISFLNMRGLKALPHDDVAKMYVNANFEYKFVLV